MSLRLPEEELRDAIVSEEWERAMAILSEHALNVQRAVDNPPEGMGEAEWRELFAQQEAFRNELAMNQTQVGQLLERVRRHSAGVRAYLRTGL